MQKLAPLFFIIALFIVVTLSGCGSGSTTASSTADTKVPTFVSYSTNMIGGAVQSALTFANHSASASIFAGTPGTSGFANYSGNTVTATFNQPVDVTTLDDGTTFDVTTFYVADYGNNFIRRINRDKLSGVVTSETLKCVDYYNTKVAILFYRPMGITMDRTNIYVADSGNNCIRVIKRAAEPDNTHTVITIGNSSGMAGYVDSHDKTAAYFNQPTGITTDGVNLYVTDSSNTVRWIEKNSWAVSTLAGTPYAPGNTDDFKDAARFNMPARITAVGTPTGTNLYLTDTNNRTIRKIVVNTGLVSTFAGSSGKIGLDNGTLDGTGTEATFYQPNGITTDGTNLYVTDSFLGLIRMINIGTKKVTTLHLKPGIGLLAPAGITTDGNSLFVADTYFLHLDNTSTLSNSILRIQ